MTPALQRLVFQLLAAAAVVSGFFVCAFAVSQLQELRQLERLPRSAPGLVMPGVVSVSGEVREHARLLQSPETKTPCVYFLRTVEHQEQEPGGEKRWRLVGSRTVEGRVPFKLGAESGETLVDLALGSPKVTARQRHQHVRIPNRYTEYRIELGDAIHVVGVAGSKDGSTVIGFDHQGRHQMIASHRAETTLRALKGGASNALVFVGLLLLTLGVTLFFAARRLHGTMSYVALVGAVSIGALTWLGMEMLTKDLVIAREDAIEGVANAANEWAARLDMRPTEQLDEAMEILSRPLPEELPSEAREQLRRYRVDAALLLLRTNAELSSFPERFVARLSGLEALPDIALDVEDEELLSALKSVVSPSRLESAWWWFPAFLAFGYGAWLTLGGVRAARDKGVIEALRVTPLARLTLGLKKIEGKAVALGGEVRSGPESEASCLWYRYEVSASAGKNRRASIENKEAFFTPPFAVEDEEGNRVAISAPQEAEVFEQYTCRRRGAFAHQERRIEPGARISVVGRAMADPKMPGLMRMTRSGRDPLIISAMPEPEVLYRKGRAAQWNLALGVNFLILFGLFATAILIGFSSLQFTLGALISALWLLGVLVSVRQPDTSSR